VRYQVAEYTIDTARYRISSGDAAIPVEPKVLLTRVGLDDVSVASYKR
jgi:hypothetical protein